MDGGGLYDVLGRAGDRSGAGAADRASGGDVADDLASASPAALSAQAVFDRVVEGLYRQGAFSIVFMVTKAGLASGCAYRIDGRRCAAGLLIEPGEYSTKYENLTVAKIVAARPDAPAAWRAHTGLVSRLQWAHDVAAVFRNGIGWESVLPQKLREIAQEFGLRPGPLLAPDVRWEMRP